MPCSARARRPRSVIQSLDQAGLSSTRTSHLPVAGILQPVDEVVAHRGHRRAPGVGRSDRDDDRVAVVVDAAQHPEVLQGQHRHLGVGDGRRDVVRRRRHDGRGHRHHWPIGCARATTCISASIRVSSSVCSPSRPVRPRTAGERGLVGTLDAADREHLLEDDVDLVGGGTRVDAEPLLDGRALDVVDEVELATERPHGVERGEQAPPGLLGPLREGEEPTAGVVAVVGELLDGLGGDGREHGVDAVDEPLHDRQAPRGEHQQPRDRHREVAVVGLDEPHVAELTGLTEEGQRVLGRHRRPLGQRRDDGRIGGRRTGEQQTRLAEQVERDVGQRDVLLEVGRAAAPLRQPVGVDERVVAEHQAVRRQRSRVDTLGEASCRRRPAGPRSRCRRPSGDGSLADAGRRRRSAWSASWSCT